MYNIIRIAHDLIPYFYEYQNKKQFNAHLINYSKNIPLIDPFSI